MIGCVFWFVCCLDAVSCTGCYWWLGDATSCIQEVSFVWILTIWYSLGLVLWYSRVLESVLPLQRLRAWSQVLHGSIYSFFCWSGTPVCSQLVSCMHFCVLRYIPDVSRIWGLFFFFLILWLCWVFVTLHRLSLFVASKVYSSFQCMHFSLQQFLLFQGTVSRLQAQ